MLESKVAVNTKFLCKEKQKHPVEVPRWPPNFAPEIKTKLKDFSGKILKKWINRGQLISHRGAKQKLWSKNTEIP